MPFRDLPSRLEVVGARIAAARERGGHQQSVQIVAVTKSHGPEAVEAAWRAGLRIVGENRVQEALSKMDTAAPVEWHLIGHLQRNKVKQVDRFDLIHSLDNARLADVLHEHGTASGRRVRALVQVNASGEDTKGGFTLEELRAEAERLSTLGGIEVVGVMTMAPFDADDAKLRATFAGARAARDVLQDAGMTAKELSMGMSNDFEVAIEEGATMVRLGTILFGERVP